MCEGGREGVCVKESEREGECVCTGHTMFRLC